MDHDERHERIAENLTAATEAIRYLAENQRSETERADRERGALGKRLTFLERFAWTITGLSIGQIALALARIFGPHGG